MVYTGDMYDLPKGYLSYSQINMWLKSPNSYRKAYFQGKKTFDTAYTRFGKNIASELENEHIEDEILSQVPRFSNPEEKIELEIEGVPFLGFIDSYNPDIQAFREYKTGIRNKSGKSPWDIQKVYTHLQLPLYSLAIQEQFGNVQDKCYLDWIETEWIEKEIEFEGHILKSGDKELRLTGYVETFERIIPQAERDATKELLVKVAQEISDDYKEFKKLS